MKKIVFYFILIFSLSSQAALTVPATEKASFSTEVLTQTHYNYNVYYNYVNPVSDASMSIAPTFSARTKPKYFYFEGDAKGRYEKFFTETVQDYFNFDLNGRMIVNEGGVSRFNIDLQQAQFSDPSPSNIYGRVMHERTLLLLTYKYKFDSGNTISFTTRSKSEDITMPSYTANKNYLSHYDGDVIGKYDIKFLPETSWFLRMSGGFRQYKNPYLSSGDASTFIGNDPFGEVSIKTRSGYFLGEVGLNGRLTDKTSVDFAAGYLSRIYPFWDDFVAPVFYMHFTEQVTRRDQLLAGYNYVVEDAYSGNYFLNQEIYVGIAKVIGDQLVALSKITYEYKNYSTPVSRNDQRITGGLTVKYSVRSDFKLMGDFRLDLLDSDGFYAPFGSGTAARTGDQPVSYKAGSISVGIIKTF